MAGINWGEHEKKGNLAAFSSSLFSWLALVLPLGQHCLTVCQKLSHRKNSEQFCFMRIENFLQRPKNED